VSDDDRLEQLGQQHGLTRRESEVISWITAGLTNSEIAAQTYLSINSIKTYIRSAYRKIGVNRRAQAAVWGLTHGFAPARRDADRP
jgi:DNA-binding CsgD family transcriptional regulator